MILAISLQVDLVQPTARSVVTLIQLAEAATACSCQLAAGFGGVTLAGACFWWCALNTALCNIQPCLSLKAGTLHSHAPLHVSECTVLFLLLGRDSLCLLPADLQQLHGLQQLQGLQQVYVLPASGGAADGLQPVHAE